jgi:hypothetical protein
MESCGKTANREKQMGACKAVIHVNYVDIYFLITFLINNRITISLLAYQRIRLSN